MQNNEGNKQSPSPPSLRRRCRVRSSVDKVADPGGARNTLHGHAEIIIQSSYAGAKGFIPDYG